MSHRSSLFGRLTRGIGAVFVVGVLALILFIALDFELLVARYSPQTPWRSELIDFVMQVALPALVLMVPVCFATWWVIRSSLAPLAVAAERVNMVAGTERGFRLETDDLPLEIVPFARAINDLLRRFDKLAEQRDALAADVAHELKTPLAILVLELDHLGGAEAERLKADVKAMCRLLDQMQLLTQLEVKPAVARSFELLDLATLAADEVARMAPIAAAQGKYLALEQVERPEIAGQREALGAALRNLIENAIQVTPADGYSTVIVGPGGQVRVRDGGPGLSETDLARFRHRGARADHLGAQRAGLGLAIVDRIAIAHGARLETRPSLCEVVLTLPVVDIASDAGSSG